jgi:stage II sporulation protein GA (sporulation sigma-E factor processing peptidase)
MLYKGARAVFSVQGWNESGCIERSSPFMDRLAREAASVYTGRRRLKFHAFGRLSSAMKYAAVRFPLTKNSFFHHHELTDFPIRCTIYYFQKLLGSVPDKREAIWLTIYLDIIWLLNFCFNGLLLWLTAIMLKRHAVWWRLACGALLGSLLVLLMFTPWSPHVQTPLSKLFFSLLIVWTSFGFKRFRYFFENLLTFYFATFMVGGGLIAVHYFWQQEIQMERGALAAYSLGAGDPVSWLFVLIGFPLLWLFSRSRIAGIREKKMRFDNIVDVMLAFDSHTVALKALIDSGNQLYDPITKTPVMIVSAHKMAGVAPPALLESIGNPADFQWLDDERLGEWRQRLRLIPYRVIGNEQRFLLAIKPDRIAIYYDAQWMEVPKGLVGLNETPLSADGEYECILHPKMIQTGKRLTAS